MRNCSKTVLAKKAVQRPLGDSPTPPCPEAGPVAEIAGIEDVDDAERRGVEDVDGAAGVDDFDGVVGVNNAAGRDGRSLLASVFRCAGRLFSGPPRSVSHPVLAPQLFPTRM